MIPQWCDQPVAASDAVAGEAARRRQDELTKPPGSLGELESLAIRLAALQASDQPGIDPLHVAVFAADHGVTAEGVSAFPQAVTLEMVRNFVHGGAAISVLARAQAAELEVIDVGMVRADPALAGVISARAGAGTASFLDGPAMDTTALATSLAAGRAAVERAVAGGARCFIGGEMGIGNTTSAAAVASAVLAADPERLAGPGTGLNESGIRHKVGVIRQGLAGQPGAREPFAALAAFGGYEIAALSGAFIAAAQARLPVVVDGFIASVAALVAVRQFPAVGAWLFYGHRSAEPGHDHVLAALGVTPVLDLGMRLGEGSGAAVAATVLRSACALHNGMATFAEAGVSRE